jgi:hypothetical protein
MKRNADIGLLTKPSILLRKNNRFDEGEGDSSPHCYLDLRYQPPGEKMDGGLKVKQRTRGDQFIQGAMGSCIHHGARRELPTPGNRLHQTGSDCPDVHFTG